VVIAASFDDIIAITGFSIFINIAIAGGANAAWQIASGPLQVRRAAGAGAVSRALQRECSVHAANLLFLFCLCFPASLPCPHPC
jgi:hypothetical protein